MKKALFLFFISIGLSLNLQSQTKFLNVSIAQLKIYEQRVNTQGTTPPQIRLNFYKDKIDFFLSENNWKADQIIAIKELKIIPANDPSDWYYFVSIKTKLCSSPFYLNYDTGDSFMGEYVGFELRALPVEFGKHIENEKAKIVTDAKAAEVKEINDKKKLTKKMRKHFQQ